MIYLVPGAVVSEIAQRHGVTRWQIYDWRRRFRTGRMSLPDERDPYPAFVSLALEDRSQAPCPAADVIEVAIGDIVVRARRDADEAHLVRIFRAIRAAT